MMSLAKKITALALALAMAAVSFSACGAAPSSATASQGAQASGEEPVSIRFFMSYATADPGYAPTMEIVEKFQKDNPSIKVEMENLSGTQYHERLTADIAADTLPNVFQHWGGSELYEAVKSGKILDLTDRMDADTQFKSGFTDAILNDLLVRYSDIPGLYGVPFSSFASGFYYNTELFEKAGIETAPATWEELLDAVKKLKAIDVIPWSLGGKDGWRVEHLYTMLFYRMNGVEAARKLADRSLQYASPEAVAPWTEIKALADMGAFGPEPASVDFGTEQSMFQMGKAGMNFSLSAFAGTYASGESMVKDKLGFFVMPAFEGKEQFAKEVFGGSEAAYGIAANSTPEQIEASWKLCQALCGPEGQTVVANANATLPVNTKVTPDPAKAIPIFQLFSDQLTNASDVMGDICAPDTVATLLTKIRDVGVAVMNNQISPEAAGAEIDAEIVNNS